jgi:hypothetical protein
MRTNVWWFLIVASVLIMGCSNDEDWYSKADKDGNFRLVMNSMERVSSNSLFLEVIDIVDNRNQVAELSSKPGFAEILFSARMGVQQTNFTLQSSKMGNPISFVDTIFNHHIEVVDVTPYPVDNNPITDKRSYVVIMKVNTK